MKCRCGCPSTRANWRALRCKLSYTTTSLSSSSRWTRYEPMNPAPPVMHTRLRVKAMGCSGPRAVVTAARSHQLRRRRAPSRRILAEREQLVLRHPAPDERGDLVPRSLEGRHNHQIKRNLVVLGDRPHGHSQKLVTVVFVEDRDR